MNRATLYVVSAPSGAGKTSLVKALLEQDPQACVSVSHTTRVQRSGEIDGVNYSFVNQPRFQKMVDNDEFLEYAGVFGNRYGTTTAWVDQALASGQDVILEIDWQGAEQIRLARPESIGIFILPPSLATLQQRLTGRGQDNSEVIQARMQQAQSEISHFREYQYLIINDDFEIALSQFQQILSSRRLLLAQQQGKHAELIEQLLSGYTKIG